MAVKTGQTLGYITTLPIPKFYISIVQLAETQTFAMQIRFSL